jgi:hypothetical protein
LLTFEVDRIALIQHFESLFLDGGKMDEDIFARGPLDESITLGTVKPLHYTVFAHKKILSTGTLPRCVQGNAGKEVLPNPTKMAYPNPRFLSGEITLRRLGFYANLALLWHDFEAKAREIRSGEPCNRDTPRCQFAGTL